MRHADDYFREAAEIVGPIDRNAVERIAAGLAALRDGGYRPLEVSAHCGAFPDFRCTTPAKELAKVNSGTRGAAHAVG